MKQNLHLLFFLLSFSLHSQSYTELLNTGLENKGLGSITTGDLNNDGYVDLISTGIDESSELSTSIYINDHDGSFTKLDVTLTPIYNATVALGDYNKDGFLDILLAGEGYDPLSSLWKNNGDLTFTEVNSGLANLGGTNAEFRDIDNDGDLDILLSGSIRNQDGSYSSDLRLYSNEGNDTFEEFDLSFTSYAVVGSLGDFDNDGDLDLVTGGNTLEVYPNNGNGSFSSPIDLGLSFTAGNIKWFDFNNDQYLDLMLAGNSVTDVLINNQDNSFSNLGGSFEILQRQKIDLRDYNNDGHIDLLLVGTEDFSTNSFITKIYDNSGTSFSQNTNIDLPQLGSGDGSWFDIDNDGDLDLILSGEEVQGTNVKKTILYQNDTNDNIYSANSIPTAPSELSWTWTNNQIVLSWGNGTDNETTSSELSYNVSIGTNIEALDILFPESDNEGFRLIQKLGNAQNNNMKLIADLENGVYFFKVQTIDGALSGSEFSEVEKFTFGTPLAPSDAQVSLDANNNANITWSDNSVIESTFIVEQKTNLDADYIEVGSVTTDETSFAISDLQDLIYTFRIKATNLNGESEYVETDKMAVGTPLAPLDIQVSLDANNDVNITWVDNSLNELSFDIEQKSNLSTDYLRVGSAERDESYYLVTSLEDAIYTFRIRSTNPNGESEYIQAEKVAVGTPLAPSNAKASIDSNSVINITWTDNSTNELSFSIEQKSNLSTGYIEVGSVLTDETSFSLSSLEDAIYTFRIKASNPNGESEYIETEEILIGAVLPIDDFLEQSLNIYPNPLVGDYMYIRVPDIYSFYEITFSDLSGKVLNPPMIILNGSWRVNTSSIRPGVYFVRLEQQGKKTTRKVIIK